MSLVMDIAGWRVQLCIKRLTGWMESVACKHSRTDCATLLILPTGDGDQGELQHTHRFFLCARSHTCDCYQRVQSTSKRP